MIKLQINDLVLSIESIEIFNSIDNNKFTILNFINSSDKITKELIKFKEKNVCILINDKVIFQNFIIKAIYNIALKYIILGREE